MKKLSSSEKNSIDLHFTINEMTEKLKFIECSIDVNNYNKIRNLQIINEKITELFKDSK